jgi:hypothetical protein
VLSALPDSARADREKLTAYAAASALVLGQRDRAAELIARLEHENRASPMVRTLKDRLEKRSP